ncbi:MAG: hypothetical protein ACKPKO_65350, partial [Candidatus Fonsibacter sp.]
MGEVLIYPPSIFSIGRLYEHGGPGLEQNYQIAYHYYYISATTFENQYAKYEVGLLYEKIPYKKNGEIISIVLKNKSNQTWKPLKCRNINNNETTECINLNYLKTDKLIAVINNISKNIPGFYAGRYDIGF